MRLDKILANSGIGTRSEVRKMIASGLVTVNSEPAKKSDMQVKDSDTICVRGEPVNKSEYLYFLFDKPDCVLSAMTDKRLTCVGDYIPASLAGKNLSPVGRLDYHTTGLLIVTNDGQLSHRLQSPSYKITKKYLVTFDGSPFTQSEIDELANGITLTDMDTPTPLAPCIIEQREGDGNQPAILTLTEGKTHEVRRICAHYGKSVTALRRISLGNLEIPEEAPAQTSELLRPLTEDEINSLRELTGLKPLDN